MHNNISVLFRVTTQQSSSGSRLVLTTPYQHLKNIKYHRYAKWKEYEDRVYLFNDGKSILIPSMLYDF